MNVEHHVHELQVHRELERVLQTPAAVDHSVPAAVAQAYSQRAALIDASAASSQALAFGVVNATSSAMAVCGNARCEFGEAQGTWGYPAAWNCPQDCPFALMACPSQVRPHCVLLDGGMIGVKAWLSVCLSSNCGFQLAHRSVKARIGALATEVRACMPMSATASALVNTPLQSLY